MKHIDNLYLILEIVYYNICSYLENMLEIKLERTKKIELDNRFWTLFVNNDKAMHYCKIDSNRTFRMMKR
jgi:hypothetical protein